MPRGIRPLVCVAAAVVGIAAEWVGVGWDRPGDWLPDLISGWVLIACGVAAWSLRPGSWSGSLLVATGFAWFAGTFSAAALYLYRGPLGHLVLAYPGLSLAPRRARVVIVAGYGVAVLPAVWRSATVTIVLAAVLVATSVAVRIGEVGRARRASAYALRATAFVAAVLVATAAVRLAHPTQAVIDATLLAYEAALCLLAVALLAGLVRAPWDRAPVTDLVVELGETRSDSLRDALASSLGDPTLELGYRIGDDYVDAAGRPIALPAAGSGRRLTPVERDGETIAVLIHDPAVLNDPDLSDGIARAARLSMSNVRLQADVRGQLAELRASRRRLVDAADAERRRLEQRLRETVERRLTQLAEMLGAIEPASENLDRARQQLALTRDSLGNLATGLHPGELADGALADALASVADRKPVPVDLSVPDARLPAAVAAAIYFVCSEAIANVVKHAAASRAGIAVSVDGRQVQVIVSDDGRGGADLGNGTGLRGLADRVEALGGALRVDSPPGRGTRVMAELPLVTE